MSEDKPHLKTLLAGPEPVFAPLALNPMMARLAELAGFKALYLGGGALGYQTLMTEANLNLTEMVELGVAIRTVSQLPLILDAASGWGDPMHMHRTMGMAEAAGFAAIEIEDQILPKRAHHHVGIEHCIPLDLMVAKIREAVAVRRDPDFLIIGRTNAARSLGIDEALRRGEALHRAGADILYIPVRTVEETRMVGERLPAPLFSVMRSNGTGVTGLRPAELFKLGYRLLVDPNTPLFAMHKALRQSYQAIAAGETDPTVGADWKAEEKLVHRTVGLDTLLEIEKRTVERGHEHG